MDTEPLRFNKYKKDAWKIFSQYIRLRDCLITTGTSELGRCFTCQESAKFKELHAGHFLKGRYPSILFIETNCHAQCYRCNIMLGGNQLNYYKNMIKIYGERHVKELIKHKNQARKLTSYDLVKIHQVYLNKIYDLKKWGELSRYARRSIKSDLNL